MRPEWRSPVNRWVWYPWGPSHPMGFPVMNQGYGGAWGLMGVQGFAGPGQEHTGEMLSPQLDREQGTKQWGENKPSIGTIIIDGRYMGSTGGLGPRTSTGEGGRETYQGSYNPCPGGRDQGGRGPGRETGGETGSEYVTLGEREGARGWAARRGEIREEIEEPRGDEEEPLDNVGEYEQVARAGGPHIFGGTLQLRGKTRGSDPGLEERLIGSQGQECMVGPGLRRKYPGNRGHMRDGVALNLGRVIKGKYPESKRVGLTASMKEGLSPNNGREI